MARKKLDYYGPSAVRGNDEILFAAFDGETEGLGGKLLSWQWGTEPSNVKVDSSPQALDNFFEDFLSHPLPFIWFAHHAQYDWRYLMDELVKRGLEIDIAMRTDTDVYQIRVKNADGKWCVMRDSLALWPSSLKEMAKSFCPELPKGDLDFDKETYDPSNPDHVFYARRDVQILLVALPIMFAMLKKHFGVVPNGTTASTAVKAWQYGLPEGTYLKTSKLDEREIFIRQAYYGGLVFLTNTNAQENAETYDLNSSYPATMCEFGVPSGRMMETRDYESGLMGIYHVRVKAPDNLRVAIIPARDKRGNMRWFRGEFDTVCTNRELIFAAQNGYEILKVYSGLAWEEVAFPFNGFIDLCKQIRFGFAGKPEETLAKLMQNSLYGKFGSRRERLRIIAAHTMTDEELMSLEATPYDDAGKWYVTRELDEDMRCNPAWAVFITAHSRLRLLQAVYSVGPDNVFYGDTDSITLRAGSANGVLDVGKEYGQWKLEKEWSVFRAIAPKVYTGILKEANKKGQLRIGAAKGLPRKNLTEQHWKELLEDGTTQAQAWSMANLRLTLKSGVKPATLLTRKSSSLENSSNFIKLPSGEVALKIAA